MLKSGGTENTSQKRRLGNKPNIGRFINNRQLEFGKTDLPSAHTTQSPLIDLNAFKTGTISIEEDNLLKEKEIQKERQDEQDQIMKQK